MIAGNHTVGPDLDRMTEHKVRPPVQVGDCHGSTSVAVAAHGLLS